METSFLIVLFLSLVLVLMFIAFVIGEFKETYKQDQSDNEWDRHVYTHRCKGKRGDIK